MAINDCPAFSITQGLPAGVHLLKTWGLGTEETPEDRETINRLKELNRKRGIVSGSAAAETKTGSEPDADK
mgnify:FL=1